MSTQPRLTVSPGTATLIGRPDSVLLVAPAAPDALVDRCASSSTSAEAIAVLTGATVTDDRGDRANRGDTWWFVAIRWDDDAVYVALFGERSLTSDHPMLPSIDAGTSTTWVERQLPRDTALDMRVGQGEDGITLDQPVRTTADGFSLRLPGPAMVEPQPGNARTTPIRFGVVSAPERPGDSRDEPSTPPSPAPDVEDDNDRDATIVGRVGTGHPAPHRTTVPSRTCPAGHSNPTHLRGCRVCGEAIDVSSPVVDISQPMLGYLVLPNRERRPIDRPIAVGRQPDAATARHPAAALLAFDAPSSVSRTHLVVAPVGWRAVVIDCGSTTGTALVNRGDEPLALAPWEPVEAHPGASIFLGGPTELRIESPDA